MVTVPKKVVDRLLKQVRTFQRILQNAKDRDVNESDTVTIVTDMLARVFGFDKYTEVTSEQVIKGTRVDLAIKLDGNIKYLIEVKAIGLDLKENHLRQAVNYGANKGIQWVVLTNGIDWRIYRIRLEKQVDYDLVCSFNFLEVNPKRKEDQNRLFILCKKGFDKKAIEKFSERIQCVNRFMIGALILTDPIVGVIRRQLRRISPGIKVTTEEIEKILLSDVLKREVVDGDSAAAARKLVKKATGKVLRAGKVDSSQEQAVRSDAAVPVTDVPEGD